MISHTGLVRRGATATAFMLAIAAGPPPAIAQSLAAQASDVTGRVVSATTHEPVAQATILLAEAPEFVIETRTEGTFGLRNVPHGNYHLVVAAPGFVTFRVEVTVPTPPLEVVLASEPHYSEVVSVSAFPRDQFAAYQPTSVLAGQDLAIKSEGSLGAALKGQPGLSERSFGPAPSRPVIRGLDGDRVLILEDGQRTGDLSSQSGDHGVTVNPAAATRLEVVRGPAALLYGANAIGGLVNVITDQIPTRPLAGLQGSVHMDVGSAASEGGGAAEFRWGNGRVGLTAGGSGRGSGNVRTPEGQVDNTHSRGALGNVGVAFVGDKGYVGASYGYDDMKYGVPVIEEGLVELTPQRHSVTVAGERRQLRGFVDGVRANLAYRRYRHDELVAGEPETTFKNDSVELKALASHRQYRRVKGTFGGWGLVRAFESIGEEALSPPVDQNGVALFLFEEVTWPHLTFQVGARYDRASYDVKEGGLPDREFDNLSTSAGLLWLPSETTTVAVSLARASRYPALEELYYFGPHPGNFAFEIGNPNLESETALGLDVAFRWRLPRATGELAFFRNDISGFIFRRPVSEEEFDARFGDGGGGDEGHDDHAHGDLPIVEYVGADSVLQGIEVHTDIDITGHWAIELSFDYLRGTLKGQDEPLPRMPPLRFTGGVRYRSGGLQVGGELTSTAAQKRVYGDEAPTDGYSVLKLYGAYSFPVGSAVHTLTARLDNVTDVLYRNHLSLIKDYVAEMGRNFKLVYSIEF